MPGPVFIQGDHVAFCTVEEDDLEFIRDTINRPQIRDSVGGQSVPSNLPQERKFFDDFNHDEEAIGFIITADEARCGFIEVNPVDWLIGVGEVGIWIAPDYQDRGFATESLTLLSAYAFDELRLHKLTAEAFAFNIPSQRALENAGFEQEGLLRDADFAHGEHIDVIQYGLLERDRDTVHENPSS